LVLTTQDEDIRERIRQAIASQKRSTPNALSCLLSVQDELGYIPDEAIEEVALAVNTSINDVWGIASFYTNFRFTPPGDHMVEVCWGPTCHLEGAAHILKALLDDLGLSGEGDTEDNKITLKYNTCLGACAQSPVISIDHRLIGRTTVEAAREHVSGLSNGSH
jgi:NADH:ubiquinone oxidoreductase subunit E